jgi:DNA-binding HxlR family transcriptional regulator
MIKLSAKKNHKKIVCCPVESTIEAIGGRWKVLIIHHLLEGTKRFGELSRLLKGVSARTLTRQLRELEGSGIVDRHVHQQIPPKVEYSLTPFGLKLKPVLYAMHDWGLELEKRGRRAKT